MSVARRALLPTIGLFALLFTHPATAARHRVVFNRIGPTRMALYLANGDGTHEQPLLPAGGLDYNPSFSTDGRWVVFTSQRAGSADIYRAHPDGSGLERLTDDPSYDDQAALSPDGSRLAFVSTRGGGTARIWVLDLTTHRCQNLTNQAGGEFRPSWSPDGNWIAFTSDRGAHPGRVSGDFEHLQAGGFEFLQSTDLYMIHADGSGQRQLTKAGGFAGSPKWSPDGRRIAYYETTPLASFGSRSRRGPSETTAAQIVSVDVMTGEAKEHTSGKGVKVSPQWLGSDRIAYVRKQGDDPGLEFTSGEKGARGEFRNPSWSPDGAQVVFGRELSEERPWMAPTFSADPTFELMLTEPFPAYSAKGDRLVVSARPPGPWPTYNFEEAGLEMMNADGSGRHSIFSQAGKNAYGAKWSPRGDLIAFALGSFFFRGTSPQLALIRPDGSGFRAITAADASSGFPSWSPDGKRLVYRSDSKHGRGLVILSLADNQMTPLTTGQHYDNFPVWSPRGDRIVFTSYRDGNYDLYTIKPDGKDLRRLTQGSGNDSHPVWSPDGKWIVFSSSRMGFKDEAVLAYRIPQPYGELFVVRSDGTGLRQLTDNQWEDATPAWMPQAGER